MTLTQLHKELDRVFTDYCMEHPICEQCPLSNIKGSNLCTRTGNLLKDLGDKADLEIYIRILQE